MNENGKFSMPRILLVAIILIIVIVACFAIFIVVSKGNEGRKRNENTTIENTIVEPQKPNYEELYNEGIAKTELPKVEINEIADVNSTIDGRIPSFYNPIIPQGFKAVGSEQDETIDEKAKWGEQNAYLFGVVIEDVNGNQFVWVPVENMKIFERTEWKSNMPKEEIESTYKEPLESEEEAYYKMYYKVKKYGGFYVGRFETGDETSLVERTAVKNSDAVGIKKNLNAYNYIPYKQTPISGREISGAQEIASNFAKRNNCRTIVTSVMYGVQWDAMLRFVVSDTNNVNSRVKWGNYPTATLGYKDALGNELTKGDDQVILLKTGASEETKAKNIYDIAGNLYEWTKEASRNDTRILRGGSYVSNIAQLAAARYSEKEVTANNWIGFRISFYVN